jgi:hypothetical protein
MIHIKIIGGFMQKTIFAILTDEQARSANVIAVRLDQEFIVGAPWFSGISLDPAN